MSLYTVFEKNNPAFYKFFANFCLSLNEVNEYNALNNTFSEPSHEFKVILRCILIELKH
jgi:hypothetical protein